MRKKQQRGSSTVLTSASEIACFVYSPEQWRREYLLGESPANQTQLSAGTRFHRRKAAAERSASGLIAVGRLMAVIGLLVLCWLAWAIR